MKKLTIMMVLFAALLTGTLYFIGIRIQSANKPYRTLENNMIEAAHVYVESNEVSVSVNDKIQIKLDKLIEDKYIETKEVNEDICDGYVEIKRNIDGYKYIPYINCNNYETKE